MNTVAVQVPPALCSYTGDTRVQAEGDTLAALFLDLDRRYPGLRFRVVDEQGLLRRHLRLFVNGQGERDLQRATAPGDSVALVLALSGG